MYNRGLVKNRLCERLFICFMPSVPHRYGTKRRKNQKYNKKKEEDYSYEQVKGVFY